MAWGQGAGGDWSEAIRARVEKSINKYGAKVSLH